MERLGLQVTWRDSLSEGAGEGLSSSVHSFLVWCSQAELLHNTCWHSLWPRAFTSYTLLSRRTRKVTALTHCCHRVTLDLGVLPCATHIQNTKPLFAVTCFRLHTRVYTGSECCKCVAWTFAENQKLRTFERLQLWCSHPTSLMLNFKLKMDFTQSCPSNTRTVVLMWMRALRAFKGAL